MRAYGLQPRERSAVDELNGKDAKALIECAGEIYSIQDPEAFPLGMLKAVERVVRSSVTAYCRVVRSNDGAVTSEILSESSLSGVDAFNRNIHEHPFINLTHPGLLKPHPFMKEMVESLSKRIPGFGSPRGKTAVKISDALTDKQFKSLAIYNDGFRKDGVSYQMSLLLSYGGSSQTVACFHRDTVDFSERDRLILNLLAPHMVQASRNAGVNAWRRRVEAGGEEDGGFVVLGPDRKVKSLTDPAGRFLARHFPRFGTGDRLPEDLDRWVSEQRSVTAVARGAHSPKVFRKAGERGDLIVRLVNGGVGEETLIVTERPRPSDLYGRLLPLGLTARESEVLYWVAHGKSNTAVAGILGITLNTVKKHLDRVYQKLGVENRTAAAKAALELLGRV